MDRKRCGRSSGPVGDKLTFKENVLGVQPANLYPSLTAVSIH
jgi:hypothetical protein